MIMFRTRARTRIRVRARTRLRAMRRCGSAALALVRNIIFSKVRVLVLNQPINANDK